MPMRMTIGRKIGLSSAFFILMILAISLVAYGGIQVLTKTLYRTQAQAETTTLVTGLQSWTLELARAQMEFIVSQTPEDEAKWQSAFDELAAVVKRVRGRLVIGEQQRALEDFIFAQERYKETFETIRDFLEETESGGMARSEAESIQRAYDMSLLRSSLLANLMIESGSRIVQLNKEEIDQRIQEVSGLVQWVQRISIMVIVVGLIVALGLGIATARSISRPVVALTRGADTIASGNLDIRLKIKSNDEIGQLASTFNSMTHKLKRSRDELEDRVRERTAELKRSNEDLEQFAYVASHDLQAPLRQIAGFVHLLTEKSKDRTDPKMKKYADFIVSATKRMRTLVDDLLKYSRVGKSNISMVSVDLNETLVATTQLLKDRVVQTKAVITHDALPTLRAHPTAMSQLLENLIGNALKYRGEKPPRVHISAVKQNGNWVVACKDNGIGIDSAHRDRIFSIFQRLHTREEYEGTGIGLSICKRIVERHGGRIWFESQVGQGTTFRFTLPIK